MVSLPQSEWLTPEAYLEQERRVEFKSEYLNGHIYAMSGGSPEHSEIAVNIASELRLQLKGKPCRAFNSDMKVRTSPAGLYAYPDVTIVCGEPRYHDERRDVLVNPTVIVEVLSPTTEGFDRGRKWAQYQRIESLTDYLIVAQDEARIEHYARQADNAWLLTTAEGLESSLALASIDCLLRLSEVYDRIAFPAPLPETPPFP